MIALIGLLKSLGGIRPNNQHGHVSRGTVAVLLVMATLVLLIMYSVGFTFMLASDGTKMLAYLRQIESANYEFRSAVGLWPHEAVVSERPEDAILVLTSPDLVTERFRDRARNLLPELRIVDGIPSHPFGKGGTVSQLVVMEEGTPYLLVVLTNVPADTWEQAERRADGVADHRAGRLQTDEDPATNAVVTVTYLANQIDRTFRPR